MALDPVTELEALLEAFESTGVGYAVCGGLALAIHGHPRATTARPREIRRVSKLDPETADLMPLDLLVVNPELERVFLGRLRVIWRGRPLAVVSRDGLAIMKRIAGRPQDLADIAKLEGTDDEDEA